MNALIAIVHNERYFRNTLRTLLTKRGYRVLTCPDSAETQNQLAIDKPDLIIREIDNWSDAVGSNESDAESILLRSLLQGHTITSTPTVICTANIPAKPETRRLLHENGILLLNMPFDAGEFLQCVESALGSNVHHVYAGDYVLGTAHA